MYLDVTTNVSMVILSAAKAVGVSGSLLLAICTQESNLKNTIVYYDGTSHSYGICMVKHGTAKMLGFKGSSSDLMVPKTNALWAAKYLKYQASRYGHKNWCKITAAYNAGSYKESVVVPGKPRNFGYVKKVQNKLDWELQDKLSCEEERF